MMTYTRMVNAARRRVAIRGVRWWSEFDLDWHGPHEPCKAIERWPELLTVCQLADGTYPVRLTPCAYTPQPARARQVAVWRAVRAQLMGGE